MHFGILGSLVVWRNGDEVPIGAAKQRALLALLLIRRGELVPTERLVDELWDERPPPTGVKALRTYVSQLRKSLGEDVLETQPGGYLLRLEPEALDSARFETLLARARVLLAERRVHEARDLLREALDLWRGPPLAEFRHEGFARDEIGRLEELRLGALEQRLETDLALGEHATSIPELETLVREYPLRETLRALLMLALYRSGRQADALAVYHDARAALVEELGLEPSETLQKLERSILTHDPALEIDTPPPASPSQPLPARSHRRVVMALGLAAVAAATAGTLVLTFSRGNSFTPLEKLAPNSIGIIDPARNALVGEIPLGTRPAAIATGDDSLWVAMQDDQTLLRLDPRTHQVRRTIGLGATPTALAVAGRYVWVLCSDTAVEVNAHTNTVVRSIPLKGLSVGGFRDLSPHSITASADAAWLAAGPGLVTRIDADTGGIEHIGSGFAAAVAAGGGTIWTVSDAFHFDSGRVSRVDPQTRRVTAKVPPPNGRLANYPNGIVADADGVWVIDEQGRSMWKVDPDLARVSAIFRVDGPIAIAIGERAVWTANNDGTISRIDPSTAMPVETVPLGRYPRIAYPVALAVGNGAVWVAVH